MPEDKSNKQQNQAIHFFHWQPKLFHRFDLPQSTVWDDKQHVSVQLWLV